MAKLRKAAAGVVRSIGGMYRIGFNEGDETEFFALDVDELEELWQIFCEENDVDKDSIDYIKTSEEEEAEEEGVQFRSVWP